MFSFGVRYSSPYIALDDEHSKQTRGIESINKKNIFVVLDFDIVLSFT